MSFAPTGTAVDDDVDGDISISVVVNVNIDSAIINAIVVVTFVIVLASIVASIIIFDESIIIEIDNGVIFRIFVVIRETHRHTGDFVVIDKGVVVKIYDSFQCGGESGYVSVVFVRLVFVRLAQSRRCGGEKGGRVGFDALVTQFAMTAAAVSADSLRLLLLAGRLFVFHGGGDDVEAHFFDDAGHLSAEATDLLAIVGVVIVVGVSVIGVSTIMRLVRLDVRVLGLGSLARLASVGLARFAAALSGLAAGLARLAVAGLAGFPFYNHSGVVVIIGVVTVVHGVPVIVLGVSIISRVTIVALAIAVTAVSAVSIRHIIAHAHIRGCRRLRVGRGHLNDSRRKGWNFSSGWLGSLGGKGGVRSEGRSGGTDGEDGRREGLPGSIALGIDRADCSEDSGC
mmetsp:Transcript_11306/g.23795  ORF Transcript_11306/g.23795 Transcript_11306/m.23795 type:complete len:398 (-) Transcript_11306:199-1392(-)